MAKVSGLGDYLAVDNSSGTPVDISNDVTSATFSNGQDLAVITGIDKSAQERLATLADGSVSINGVFNSASSHTVFSALGTARTVTYCVGGNSGGNPKLTFEGLIENYDLERGTDGTLNWSASVQLSNGTALAWSTV
tara:strand:- start:648 stop:1058 length:411 start_codon:yes stop_codon:yes gene_type:complete